MNACVPKIKIQGQEESTQQGQHNVPPAPPADFPLPNGGHQKKNTTKKYAIKTGDGGCYMGNFYPHTGEADYDSPGCQIKDSWILSESSNFVR